MPRRDTPRIVPHMTFSHRTDPPWEENRISVALARVREQGTPVLDLTGSNPTVVGLPYPEDAITAAFSGADWLTYAPEPRGLLRVREAVAAWYAGRGTEVCPDRVLLAASTSEAYGWLFQLLADPGDEVLVPAPSYPLLDLLARPEGLRTLIYPLEWDGRWRPDFALLEQAVTKRTRAVVWVNPNNPTGTCLHADERKRLIALCVEHGLPLICDEVFSEYFLGEGQGRVRSLADETTGLVFCLNGLSKAAGLPQAKLGWIVVAGPEEEAAEALRRLEFLADLRLSVSGPTLAAAPALLGLADGIAGTIRGRLEASLGILRHAFPASSPVQLQEPEGGWTAVLRLPATHTGEEWALTLLERDGVLVQPGYFYDFPGEAYLVVSLLTPPDVLTEGLDRMAARIAGNPPGTC